MDERTHTPSGWLRGAPAPEDDILVFRGIPYAEPPVGKLRFRAPEPVRGWSGVRDATAFGSASPQLPLSPLGSLPALEIGRQDEDCLTLNVYAPRSPAPPRPVMVWIHGGGYTTGSSSQGVFDGGLLARSADAVVVTINYRLGALGFAFLDQLGGAAIGAAPNAGTQDQLAALRWVRDHVACFGADPECVTLFGQSAGAHSVATLLALPDARGLVHRAILQSGSVQPAHTRDGASRVSELLMKELELGPGDAERLQRVSVEELMRAQTRVVQRLRTSPERSPFRPVVDGEVLPGQPLERVEGGCAAAVPSLVGTTRDEWQFFDVQQDGAELDEARVLARIEEGSPGVDAARILAGYGAGARRELRAALSAIETDRFFRIPALRFADAQRGHQPDTYVYRFDWGSPALDGRLGACHSLDVPCVFGRPGAGGLEPFTGSGPEVQDLSRRMMAAWARFARTGRPDCAEWARHDRGRRPTMLLGRHSRVELDPAGAERRLWDGVELARG